MERQLLKKITYIITAAAILCGCTRPYAPPPIKAVTGYLVVEGVIDAGNDSTKFLLSRTVNLTASSSAPVTGAQVTVEGSDNSSHPLINTTAGTYMAPPLNLDQTKTYRLHIKTTTGEDYVSDYVPVKITPPIDTVNYVIESNGLQINLNTHDPANNTRYYRWDYTEEWEFHSQFYSSYMSTGDTVIERPVSKQIYFCYQGDASTTILLGSSAKLVQDVISTAPITFIPSTSEKLETEYSIQVKQYALTSDAYNFWQNLKKNTEELGSIFDAQPSQINGNIYCTNNPAEPVIGYISASTIQAKRIFVDNIVLPHWIPISPYSCTIDSILLRKVINGVPINQENLYFNKNKGATGDFIPVNAIVTFGGAIIGHTGSDAVCVDCTFRGSITKPSYWQ